MGIFKPSDSGDDIFMPKEFKPPIEKHVDLKGTVWKQQWTYPQGLYPLFLKYNADLHGPEPPSDWIKNAILKSTPGYMEVLKGTELDDPKTTTFEAYDL